MHLRILLGLALCAAALYVLWQWRDLEAAAARRLAAWQAQQRVGATEAALEREITLTGREVSLAEFAALLSRASGQSVEIDEPTLQAVSLTPRYHSIDSSDVPQGRFPVRAALGLALEQRELCYDIFDQRIVITTVDNSHDRNHLRTVVYPLPQPQFRSQEVDPDRWANLLVSLVEPDEWHDVGGRGHCEAVPGSLVITQTEHMHRQIRGVLASLSHLENPPQSLTPVPLPPFLSPQAERKHWAALQQPASANYVEAPLEEVTADLAQRHGIPIHIQIFKLQEAGVRSRTPVTIAADGASLEAIFRRILDDLDLTLMIRHGVLVVTTPEDAESPDKMPLVAYPVHDLVAADGVFDYAPLKDLIQTTVAPESWDVSGPESIGQELDGWLIISQTYEVHQQIEQLLVELRQHLGDGTHKVAFRVKQPRPGEMRARAALDQPIALRFVDTPLCDAVAWIAGKLKAPIVVNARRLGEVGVQLDTPITCDLPAAPLRNQLNLILSQLDLTFEVRHEALAITTREDAESPDHLTIRVYDIRPHLDRDLGVTSYGRHLIDLVQMLIEPESWVEVGGPGSIQEFRGLVVVSQREATHERIQRLFTALERNCLRRVKPAMEQPTVVRVDATPRQAQIEELLEQPTDISLQEVPLESALEYLAELYGLPLVLDRRRLDQAGVGLESLVSISRQEITRRSALRQILDEIGLTWRIRDEVLLVTTTDRLDDLPIVAYRIDDLVEAGPGLQDPGPLIDLVQTAVAAERWVDVGGEGSIKEIRDWLLVAQTDEVHEQIESLLARMRGALSEKSPPAILEVSADRPAERRIHAALDREVALPFGQLPLDHAIARLAARCEVPLVLSMKGLAEAGVWLDQPVTWDLAAAPLESQLRLLLSQLDLTFAVRDEALLITSPDIAEETDRLPIRVYDVRRLVDTRRGILSSEQLLDLLTQLIERDDWVDVGGFGSAKEHRGLLVASQTDVNHRRIERLLAALARHCLPRSAAAAAELPKMVRIDGGAAEERIERLLDKPIDVDFRNQPLQSALRELAERHGLPLVLDERKLETRTVWNWFPVTYSARGQRLGTVLDRWLIPRDLTYIVRDHVLLVTRAATFDSDVRLHRVDDLLRAKDIDLATLSPQMMEAIGSVEWFHRGSVHEVGSAWLAVAADTHLHQRLEDYLSEQRTGRTPQRELDRRDTENMERNHAR
jgi:hypothetical protein